MQREAGEIASWSRQAIDETAAKRIRSHSENDRNSRCRLLCSRDRISASCRNCDTAAARSPSSWHRAPRRWRGSPAGVAEVDAAAVALVGLTALQALRDEAHVGRGASVLINGASGGVGTVAVQIARILGARVTTVSSAETAELCRLLGADETLDYTRLDETLGGARFNVMFDVFGNLRFARARAGLRRRGVFVSTVLTPRRLSPSTPDRFSNLDNPA